MPPNIFPINRIVYFFAFLCFFLQYISFRILYHRPITLWISGKEEKHHSMQDQFSNKQLSTLSTTGIGVFFILKFTNFVISKHCEIFKKNENQWNLYTQKKKFKKIPQCFCHKNKTICRKKKHWQDWIHHPCFLFTQLIL
jgi:hypothetical protein